MNYYQPQSRFATPQVVLNLLIINALCYMAQAIVPKADDWLVGNFGLFFWESAHFRPWQIVTYMFLHGNFEHLFFNMFALWMFGRQAEYDMGPKRFLTYYFITGIGAGVLQQLVSWITVAHFGGSVDQLTIGASGAIFGLLLSFGVMHPNSVIMLLIPPIPMKAKWFVVGYGVFELFFGVAGIQSNVAHFAHLGGMLFGWLLLRYWKRKRLIYY